MLTIAPFFVIPSTKASILALTATESMPAKRVGQRIMILKHVRNKAVVELEAQSFKRNDGLV